MKFWFEAILETVDDKKQCSKCGEWSNFSENVFVEFELVGGELPNPNELHPEPTGKLMCNACAKAILI